MNQLQTVLDALESLQRYDGTLTGAQVTEAIAIIKQMMRAKPVAGIYENRKVSIGAPDSRDIENGWSPLYENGWTPIYTEPKVVHTEPVGYFYQDEGQWKQAFDLRFKDAHTPLYLAQQSVPAGFVLVHVEPTEAMRNAAIVEQEHHRKMGIELYGDGPASEIYKAMIAAAHQV